MADYKSMIKGTISAVGKKAKEYVESGALKDAYDRSSTTAMCYANIAKLNLQINGELEEQKKVFTEIGTSNYEYLMPYLSMALIYIILVLLITLLFKMIEKQLHRSDRA